MCLYGRPGNCCSWNTKREAVQVAATCAFYIICHGNQRGQVAALARTAGATEQEARVEISVS